MKKLISLYETYMIRPILYRTVTKAAFALTAMLLWNRYLNEGGKFQVFRDAGLLAGVFLVGMAWFSYLRLDGMTVHHLLEERKRKPKPVRGTSDMVDFVDEHIVSFAELSEEERTACNLASSLLAGLLFLIPAVILTVMAL